MNTKEVFKPKQLTRWGRIWRRGLIAILVFDALSVGVSLTDFKLPMETKTVYNATSTVVVTNEKAEWIEKWLTSKEAYNLAEHEYLLAKKAEVEKELNANRTVSLR